jgi:uncharacterized protein (DUF1778 family)
MATDSRNDARLNFRLPVELKEEILEAATCLGQSVSDFAISALAQTARGVMEQYQTTRLSQRDRKEFLALLDDSNARPNKALKAAAKRYRDRA